MSLRSIGILCEVMKTMLFHKGEIRFLVQDCMPHEQDFQNMPRFLKTSLKNWDANHFNVKRVLKIRGIAFWCSTGGFIASPFAFAINRIALLMGLVFCLPAQLFQFLICSFPVLEGIQP